MRLMRYALAPTNHIVVVSSLPFPGWQKTPVAHLIRVHIRSIDLCEHTIRLLSTPDKGEGFRPPSSSIFDR
jgi:hypothetical protein